MTMTSTHLLTRAGSLTGRLPEKTIRRLLTLALAAVAIWQLAALVWQWLTPLPKPVPWVPTAASSANAPVNLSALKAHPLFGTANSNNAPAAAAVALDAPQTRLNLRLTGLVAENENGSGVAIIENQGKQAAYRVGETIQGTGAVVKRILPDRLLLENRNQTEALMLDGKRYTPLATPPRPARSSGKADVSLAASRYAQLIKTVQTDPAKLSDMVRFTPVRRGGKLQGFQVSPGKDATLFLSLGLKAGDLVTAINGHALSDPAQAMTVMNQLSQLQELELSLVRGGQDLTINVKIAP